MIGPYDLPLKLVWTNGARSSLKVSVLTGIGPIECSSLLPAKFGRRFLSFFCWGKSSEAFSTKTPPQISPSNFTTRFWLVAGPTFGWTHSCRSVLLVVPLRKHRTHFSLPAAQDMSHWDGLNMFHCDFKQRESAGMTTLAIPWKIDSYTPPVLRCAVLSAVQRQ